MTIEKSVENVPPDVLDALKAGNKIEAIKRFRVATGLGLAEAKAVIEALEGQPNVKKVSISVTTSIKRNPGVAARLAPGQVPKGDNKALAAVVLAIVAAALGWLAAKYF